MQKFEKENISYKEILIVNSDSHKHTRELIGICEDENLLLISETETNSDKLCSIERLFFQIDFDEYLRYLGLAAKNNRLERSLRHGATSLEAFYLGKYFHIGTSIDYIINQRKFSIFASSFELDSVFAEEHNFNQIDKFEYEKTLKIHECDAIRITHTDENTGEILKQVEISIATFESSILS